MKAMIRQRLEKPLINLFLDKHVTVEVEKDLEVRGKFLRYEFGSKNKGKPHRPNVLIVENSLGRLIIRGNWIGIGLNYDKR